MRALHGEGENMIAGTARAIREAWKSSCLRFMPLACVHAGVALRRLR
jgi:hypothetical protein